MDLGGALFPLDSVGYSAKTSALCRVDHLHKTHAALEVRAKLLMAGAILGGWTQPDAIRQRGFEAVEVSAYDVHVAVRDEPREVLPHPLPHDARLAVVHAEAFPHQNRSHMN